MKWLGSLLEKKEAINLSWMLSERLIRLVFGFLVGVWIARHLGPQSFGLLTYALAVVGLIIPLATLNLNPLIVNTIVENPAKSSVVITSALLIRITFGLLSIIIAIVVALLLNGKSRELELLILILGVTLFFQASDVLKAFFEAEGRLKPLAITQILTYLVSNFIKIYLILTNGSVVDFAVVIVIESLIGSLLVTLLYVTTKSVRWEWSSSQCVDILTKAWPLALSGLAITVYLKIDQVMMGFMAGEYAVGIYNAAVRLSEVWYFFPVVYVMVVFPVELSKRSKSENEYLHGVQGMLNVLVIYSLAVAVLVTFSSSWLIVTLFGKEYSDAAPVLAVYIWAGIFVALGTGSSRWYIVENVQVLHLYKVIIGALLNIFLNIILIPILGGVGAAIATLVSYSISAYFSDFFMARTRLIFRMKTQALLMGGLGR